MLTLSPGSVVLFSGQTAKLTATDSRGPADVVWSVNGVANGNSTVGTIDGGGNFEAPSVTENTSVTITASSQQDPSISASAMAVIVPTGQVTSTQNLQVAQYTLTPPVGTNVFIQFSQDMSYGMKTSTQPAPTTATPLSIYVAGMLPSTEYHMRGVLVLSDGSMVYDDDHTFTTGAIPANQIPVVTTTTTPGLTPQPGVEMLDLIGGTTARFVAATNLSGQMIWSYPFTATTSDVVQPVRVLPNGNFLVVISPTSTAPTDTTPPVAGTIDVIREIDLAGNVIHEVTLDSVNAALATMGSNLTLGVFHHDSLVLPNGHWIVLSNMVKACADVPGCTGTTSVLGDVLVDLAPQSDGTFQPVWTWSTFDHLDIARAPWGLPDWTHCNAILYSADDGNLLLSSRHQNWIMKIDYENGAGSGKILWRLGYQGDFTLVGGTDPTDWFYAQHLPSFTTSNTTGKFGLGVMDNGNSRKFASGVTCGTAGEPPCGYSAARVFQVDESAMTATLTFTYLPGEFSIWGGNVEQLANGNIEADFNAGSPTGHSDIFEVTQDGSQQVVWHMQTSAQNAYRGYRIPSLYPGVQW